MFPSEPINREWYIERLREIARKEMYTVTRMINILGISIITMRKFMDLDQTVSIATIRKVRDFINLYDGKVKEL